MNKLWKNIKVFSLLTAGVILFIGGAFVLGWLDFNRTEFSELKFFISNFKLIFLSALSMLVGAILVGLGLSES